MPFRTWFPSIAPPPMRGKWGKRYFEAIGELLDETSSRIRQGVLARFPGKMLRAPGEAEAVAPDDALARIGGERQLPRGPGETSAAYAERLLDAWKLWAGDDTPITGKGGPAGSHRALLLQLKFAGFPTGATGATIVQYNGRYAQLDGSDNLVLGDLQVCHNRLDLTGVLNPLPGWTFDSQDRHWASFGIVFGADVVGLDDTPGNAKKATLNALAMKWRPSSMWYRGAWVHAVGGGYGWPAVGNTWGDGSNWGGDTVRFISPP